MRSDIISMQFLCLINVIWLSVHSENYINIFLPVCGLSSVHNDKSALPPSELTFPWLFGLVDSCVSLGWFARGVPWRSGLT